MKYFKKVLIIFSILIISIISIINLIVISKSNNFIDKDINYNDYDYVLVLGAKVYKDRPSKMLKDRLDKALEIYNQNNNIKIIISGDSVNSKEYDEVGIMYDYLINNNVNKDNIITDTKGINTSTSILNTKEIVNNKKVIIVTQKYHLTRSIYIARNNNINCYGISSYNYKYVGQLKRDLREILARVKDYIFVKLNISPKYEVA